MGNEWAWQREGGSWEVGVAMEGKTWYRGQTVGGMAWQ